MESLFAELLIGLLVKINNFILKLRGLKNVNPEKTGLKKLKKIHELNPIIVKMEFQDIEKGTKGIVEKIIDQRYCIIETFDGQVKYTKIPLTNIVRISKWPKLEY